MVQLTHNPKVVQLAKDLGLDWRRDSLGAIREFAMREVERITRESPLPVDTLDALRWVVADKFRVRLEFIRANTDIERIASEHPDFHRQLRQRLVHEFLESATEGITLEREEWDPRRFRYLAVIDARDERASRAYFTAWHELTHLLVHPQQLRFPGFRRTPPHGELEKDPLESVIDHVAGRVAFYPSLFRDPLERAMKEHAGLTFAAIDAARAAAAPSASLFATATGSVNYAPAPTVLVTAAMGLKAAERRLSVSPQQAFEFAEPAFEARLRVPAVVSNELVQGSKLAIRRNMRVPPDSVLMRAFESPTDTTLSADEDQAWWETSREGPLPAVPVKVEAIRRGRFVYGLIVASA